MKRILCLVLMAFSLSFPVSAEGGYYECDDFSLTFPSHYTVLDKDNLSDNAEFIGSIKGNTPASFGKHMESMSMVVYSAPAGNAEQFQLCRWSDSVSQTVVNLTSLTDALFVSTADGYVEQIEKEGRNQVVSYQRVFANDTAFIKFIVRSAVGDDSFGSVQYLTISKGEFFTLGFYNARGDITEEQSDFADSVFKTFDLKVEKEVDMTFVLVRIVGVLVILGGAVAGVLIVRSIVTEWKMSKTDEDTLPKKIKMNRKKRK